MNGGDTSMKTYDGVIRVSQEGGRDMDAETTHTINDQKRAVMATAKLKGGTIGKWYTLTDQSGFDVLATYGDEWLDRVRTGKTRGQIVGYSDRLTRNSRQGGAYLDKLEAEDGEVWDATMPQIDYRTDEGRLIWGMKMVINEQPSLAAKTRSRRIVKEQVEVHGYPSRLSYGYRRNGTIVDGVVTDKTLPERHVKVLVPDYIYDEDGEVCGGEAPIVCRIFDMRDAGIGWVDIARVLNDEGVPGPSGKPWQTATIRSIIANEVYLGYVIMGALRNEQAHEPLVSRAQFKRVQAGKRIAPLDGWADAGIARGLLRCITCGSVMACSTGQYPNFGCRSRHRGARCEQPMWVSAKRANAYVEAVMIAIIESGEGVDLIASAREIEKARVAAVKAKESRQRFVKFVDTLSDEDFRAGYAEKQEIERVATDHYNDLVARAGDAEDLPTSASAWKALDLPHRRRVAKQLIERITVSPSASGTSRYAAVEDRFDVFLVGGVKMNSTGWQLAA